jgi:hypothetical protein
MPQLVGKCTRAIGRIVVYDKNVSFGQVLVDAG